jgi:uncharacterized protein (TIGR03437 family)
LFALLGALIVGSPPIDAQPCPAVQFEKAFELRASDANDPGFSFSWGGGLELTAPGAYTMHQFSVTPPFGKRATIPNVQRQAYRCTGENPAAPSPNYVLPRVSDDFHLGRMSTVPLATDLRGDGTFSFLAYVPFRRPTALFVIQADAAITQPTFSTVMIPNVVEGLVAADFNSDQRKDFAALIDGPNFDSPASIAVFLNQGNGVMERSAADLPLPAASESMVAIDLNGDSRPDLAAATTDRVAVLLNNGNGNFTNGPVTQVAGCSFANSLVSADFNGDSRNDLITGCGRDLYFLAANGDGSFRAPVKRSIGSLALYLTAADFNADGRMDLAALARDNGFLSVLTGDGSGGFSIERRYVVNPGTANVMPADFDADGILDLVVATGHPAALLPDTGAGTVTMIRGRGDGSFIAPESLVVPGNVAHIAGGDFNADGRQDLVAIDRFGGAYRILTQQANGSFQAASTQILLPGGNQALASQVIAADFDADNRLDLAMSARAPLFFKGDGNGTFANAVLLASANNSGTSIAAGDVNGDGRPDLISANEGGGSSDAAVSVFLNNGGGGFQSGRVIHTGVSPSWLAAADLNRDGRDDVIVADRGEFANETRVGDIAILLSGPGGTFGQATRVTGFRYPNYVGAGDLNGDNNPDLVFAADGSGPGASLVHVLIGRGDGTFQPPATYATSFGPSSITIADLNGDSRVDLFVGHCCGDTSTGFLAGNGDGTFRPEVDIESGESGAHAVITDINRDGKPDLFISNGDNLTGAIAVLINRTPAFAQALAVVSSATFQIGPVAAESLASAFGARLATATEAAAEIPLPITLAGTTVTVRDSAGVERQAQLVFVSAGQVNFLLPAGLAPGLATVTVRAGDGTTTSGVVEIRDLGAGLFSVNTNRLAAANLLRSAADGTQTAEPVAQLSGSSVVPLPINLENAADRVFLILFGTGLRANGGVNAIRATAIGGFARVNLPVLYAGDQGFFPGLDQVNLELSPALRGRGDTEIHLEVDGILVSSVRVTIQ